MTQKAGETTFNAGINLGGNIVFEGSTANSFETTLTVTDPTADRTVTLPNETFKLSSYANKATLDGWYLLQLLLQRQDMMLTNSW